MSIVKTCASDLVSRNFSASFRMRVRAFRELYDYKTGKQTPHGILVSGKNN